MIVSIAAATGLTAIAQASQGRTPDATVFVGGAIVAVVLSIAGRSRPELAAKLAATILVTSAMVNGATVAQATNRYLGRDK